MRGRRRRSAANRRSPRRAELVLEVAQAKATLTRWTGEAKPEIAGPIPDFAVDAAALKAGLDGTPSISEIDAQSTWANADVRVAEANRRPDFLVNLTYQRRDPRFGDYVSAGLTISLPTFTRRRQSAEISAA